MSGESFSRRQWESLRTPVITSGIKNFPTTTDILQYEIGKVLPLSRIFFGGIFVSYSIKLCHCEERPESDEAIPFHSIENVLTMQKGIASSG